jgi:hypothetical protein
MKRISTLLNSASLALLMVFSVALQATTYYVDSAAGNDANDGLSELLAWQTITHLNTKTFAPGDNILFKRDGIYAGQFNLQGSGESGSVITLSAYGSGEKPILMANDADQAALYMTNNEYIEIDNLQFTNNHDGLDVNYGVLIEAPANFGELNHIIFDNVEFVDIKGKTEKCHGMLATNAKDDGTTVTYSNYKHFHVTNSDFRNIDGPGFKFRDRSGSRSDGTRTASVDFVFSYNSGSNLEKFLVSWSGVDGALVEHNYADPVGTVHGNGLWPFNSDDSVVQFNDMRSCRGGADGHGYDADFNSHNSLFQYNYSQDCTGGAFVATCNGADASNFNTSPTFRYNVSVNDGWRTGKGHSVYLNGCISDVKVYNNTFYYAVSGLETHPVEVNNWGDTWPKDIEIKNNIWRITDGTTAWVNLSEINGLVMDSNVYSGLLTAPSQEVNAITTTPVFVNEGGSTADDYKLYSDTQLSGVGVEIVNNGARDYFGNVVNVGTAPTPGAHEIQTDTSAPSGPDDVIITGVKVVRSAKGVNLALTQAASDATKNTYNGSTSQQWTIIHLSNGNHNIVNLATGHYLRQSASGSEANVDLYDTATAWKSLQWRFIDLGTGNYKIIGVRDIATEELALRGGGKNPGNVDIYTSNGWATQEWTITDQ